MEPGLRVSSQAGREKEKEPFCDMTHDERFSAGAKESPGTEECAGKS